MRDDHDPPPFWDREVHAARRPRLLARARAAAAVRAWFAARDFVEVETDALQVSPGNETHLSAYSTEAIGLDGARRLLHLHTSPEFAMKKLLAAGETRIFSVARVFRNREGGRLHAPEFTMLEWYRVGAPLSGIADDAAALCAEIARACGAPRLAWRGRAADPFAPAETVTTVEAFRRAGVDLEAAI
ncbi:MAG: EF-P lysine aminoacylase GenX, partial [Hyphomicrobiales bacterium]|nr:EF-P lysine aminoacylase GenX [Hyphomicrobiales bacterium]